MGARKPGDPDFHSERDQLAAMREAVRARGGGIDALDELPSELDVSGGLPLDERPTLRGAVEGVEAGAYCGIVVAYQSRLSRNPEVDEEVHRRVEAAGGQIIYALEPLDTATIDGRMMRRFRSAMNAGERERHVERFDVLRREATAAGIWQSRQTPTGYRRGKSRKLEPDERAGKVREAFLRRAAGATMTDLGRMLGMTTSGVRHLLRNRVYLGELQVGRYVNPKAHPALVNMDEFEAAQRHTPRPARRVGEGPALLAGLVRCQGCGHVMSRTTTARLVYSCHGRSSAGDCPAPAAVTVALLDALVTEIVLPEVDRLLVASAERGGDLTAAREAVVSAERELATFVEAVSAADVGAEVFAAGARKRREQIDAARGSLRRLVDVAPVLPAYGSGRDVWEALGGHERNALLRGLLEVVIVRAGGRGKRTPLTDRVRVVRFGAGVVGVRRRAGAAAGIVTLPWLDGDDERVLRVPGGEDRLESAGG